jgi:hypothetical protein
MGRRIKVWALFSFLQRARSEGNVKTRISYLMFALVFTQSTNSSFIIGGHSPLCPPWLTNSA